jgi:hypothetical protein
VQVVAKIVHDHGHAIAVQLHLQPGRVHQQRTRLRGAVFVAAAQRL